MGVSGRAGRIFQVADSGGKGGRGASIAGARSGGSARASGALVKRKAGNTIQGLNATCSIYERAQGSDDSVGGSVRTDALRYAGVKCRISNARPSSLLMQQGFTITQMQEVVIYPDAYPDIIEEDIIIPTAGQWPNQRLRVVGVQRSSLPPGHPRSHIQLWTERYQYADSNTDEV